MSQPPECAKCRRAWQIPGERWIVTMATPPDCDHATSESPVRTRDWHNLDTDAGASRATKGTV